jgi:hypothetical protein
MNPEWMRSRVKHVHLAAFALLWVLTGCNSETGSFNAAASEKLAAEKGLRPGGPAAKVPVKLLRQGRQTTETGGSPLPKP